MNLTETIFDARRVAVPLVYLATPDAEDSIHKLRETKSQKYGTGVLHDLPTGETTEFAEMPLLSWDIAIGLNSINPRGEMVLMTAVEKAVAQLPPPANGASPPPFAVLANGIRRNATDPNAALTLISQLPPGTITFYLLMIPDAFFKGPKTLQQVWNLRKQYAGQASMLIFVGPDVSLPPSIAGDIMMVRDPRPDRTALEAIVRRQHVALSENNEDVAPLSDEDCTKAALSLQGLAPFSAATAVAMSLHDTSGIDFLTLREQRYEKIERPGLKVWKGNEQVKDLVGIDGVINLLLQSLRGKRRPGAVFFFDEINHEMAGVDGGDLSGMADKYLAQILTYMENLKVQGFLFLGSPGTGKTEVSKAIGNAADILTMAVDLGACKSREMGSSEQNLREVLDVITAVSGGVPLFLGSCNNARKLPSSLWRRFKTRVYFDHPKQAAKQQGWKIKMAKYGLPEQLLPNDDEWTISDIENCCEKAWMVDGTIMEASRSVIPVMRARPQELQDLRQEAHNKFVDAATGEAYVMEMVGSNNNHSVSVKSERKTKLLQ